MKMKLPLHFAYANGFPANSYRKLFSHLDERYEVISLEQFAHPFLRKHKHIRHIEIKKGGHMFPLEQPIKVAEIMNGVLNDWY